MLLQETERGGCNSGEEGAEEGRVLERERERWPFAVILLFPCALPPRFAEGDARLEAEEEEEEDDFGEESGGRTWRVGSSNAGEEERA